jgi:hypothetical protein
MDKPIFYNGYSIRSAFASYEARGVELSQHWLALVQTLSELGESGALREFFDFGQQIIQ